MKKNSWLDLFILLAIGSFLLSYFEPHYLLSPTITTGGDTASHYYAAHYLKEVLLPQGKIMGWTQGNYAGQPLFLFYFPLPFLLMVLLSYVISLQIAFKLVTVLGIFLLPVCAYFSLKQMAYKFPTPIFGALSTLPFLFMEANSMWGGNISSTLAGEFAFSLGFGLVILFVGSLYSGILSGRHVIRNGILVALIGFSHGYALLFAGLASLFFLITKENFSKKLVYLIKIHGLGFMLIGLWILPLLWNLSNATAFNVAWVMNSILEVFPVILLPLVGMALLGGAVHVIRNKKSSDPRIFYLWFCVLISGFVYHIAYQIHVVDVRFLPFLQILLCLLAAIELGRLADRGPRLLKTISPILLAVAVFFWAGYHEKNIKSWVNWNYTGVEGKPAWPIFAQINQALLGTPSDPRVVYEHSTIHNAMGTVRAFEALPLFSGRSTLEGLYIQASLSVPFIFYIQSEISKEISCPLPDYNCTKIDLENAIKHLKMFNVRDFIVVSDEVKALVSKRPEFKLKQRFANYEIYELTSNENRYVTPLEFEPVVHTTKDWKWLSYRWFKKSSDVHLVFLEEPGLKDLSRFKTVRSGKDLENLPRIPVEGPCQVEEDIRNEEIFIKTDCIDRPLLIKISYHPNWKVQGADRVYLVSPSFMLIYPNRENVKLTYSRGKEEVLGIFLSIAGLLILVLHAPWLKGSRTRVVFEEAKRRSGRWMTAMVTGNRLYIRLSKFLRRHGLKIRMVIGAGLVVLLSYVAMASNQDSFSLYHKGIKYYGEKNHAKARSVFEKVIKKYPDTRWAEESELRLKELAP